MTWLRRLLRDWFMAWPINPSRGPVHWEGRKTTAQLLRAMQAKKKAR